MRDTNIILDEMSEALNTIQTKKVNPKKVEQVMNTIVVDIKYLNNRLEIYLKQQQAVFEDEINTKKEKYAQI